MENCAALWPREAICAEPVPGYCGQTAEEDKLKSNPDKTALGVGRDYAARLGKGAALEDSTAATVDSDCSHLLTISVCLKDLLSSYKPVWEVQSSQQSLLSPLENLQKRSLLNHRLLQCLPLCHRRAFWDCLPCF